MRILLAEDEPALATWLVQALRQSQFQVDWVNDGRLVRQSLKSTRYDALILDLGLPGRDGHDVLADLRDADQRLPVLILTARDSLIERVSTLREGADDFLAKPLDRDQIWMRLRVAKRILGYTREIVQLESLLPVCVYCKKVRDDNNYWEQIEHYISRLTGEQISHSVCPDCYEKIVKPQIESLKIPYANDAPPPLD